MNKEISDLLFSIPENVDYTEVSADLDLEDIPVARVQGVIDLLKSSDKYIAFKAAKLLTFWGDDEGFSKLVKLLEEDHISGFINNRLYGYDETLKHALDALISYWAVKSDQGEGDRDVARAKIFPYILKIIDASNDQSFQISSLFWIIIKYNYSEYIMPLKVHLEKIVDHPEIHGWKIYDAIEFLLKIDPDFVNELLLKKGKTLQDFNF
ncbi:hypothetical protein [Acinetobacter guillouiae]|uniref:hypothetical protein n=1 Tax=Acinetobacter guillouiae TaxID=106649 RepID=UPI0028F0253E|nr:hypothetical protein [Acinetobacter guillouiae]